MYIEDEELRELYKTSSSEHLQKLEADLMILEKNPQDSSAMEDFLREAHTLKGDSRMLGLDNIEKLVHQLEDCLEGIKAGNESITPELCDRLYLGIDAVNQLSHEAITGEKVEVNTSEVLASLTGDAVTKVTSNQADGASEASLFEDENDDDLFSNSASSEVSLFEDEDDDDLFSNSASSEVSLFEDEDDDDLFSNSTSSEVSLFEDEDDLGSDIASSEASLFEDENDLESNIASSEASLFEKEAEMPVVAKPAAPPEKVVAKTEIKPAKAAPSQQTNYQIDTIRVEPQKLDVLMTQASELAVTKLRISQQMMEINQMTSLWENWSKDNNDNSSIFSELELQLSPEQFQPLKYFLNSTQQHLNSLGGLVNNLKTRANEDGTSLGIISDRLETGIQGLRQLPLNTVFNIYPRMVRDLARQQGKEIEFIIQGADTKADKKILESIKDPLLHLIRNAIDHGIETPEERLSQGKSSKATLTLRGYQIGSSIGIEISDDGRGLNLDSIRNTALKRKVKTEAELAAMSEAETQSLIFASGFSTRTEITELSGRGVGLDVVRANVEKLKGSVSVNSTPGNGCKFQVRLNTSLATTKVLIVNINQTIYALPLEFVQTMITISRQDIYEIDEKPTIDFEDQPISISWLANLLQLGTPENYTQKENNLFCVILQIGNDKSNNNTSQRFGVIVDDLVDQQDIVIKPQSKLLKRIPNVSGATILGSGEVCMILNPADLLHSLRNGGWQNISVQEEAVEVVKNRLLLVEDSIIIRTQMLRLLKGAGYEVTVAENGAIGLQKVLSQNFDIVLSDVEMPNMSGLEMTANIRQNSQYNQLPIVLVTTLASPEDKRRGKEAGANAYLTKGDFDQQLLFATLKQLIHSESI